jgi:creatinine amidohydrolase/Fe(II)-dependent formamide hydrolase-like protein
MLAARGAMLDFDTETRIAQALAAGASREKAFEAKLIAVLIVGGARHALVDWLQHHGKISLRVTIASVFAAVQRSGFAPAPRK